MALDKTNSVECKHVKDNSWTKRHLPILRILWVLGSHQILTTSFGREDKHGTWYLITKMSPKDAQKSLMVYLHVVNDGYCDPGDGSRNSLTLSTILTFVLMVLWLMLL